MTLPPPRKLALITGASSGIGLELAKQFAANGFDLIIAAENAAIFAAASQLEGSGASVEAVQVDLSAPAGVDELYARIQAAGRPLAAAALNAGIGAKGAFAVDISPETELRIIDLNVRATVHLAQRVVPDMVRRGGGRVLVTSSTGAVEPGAFQAVYNASKSFLQSFALSLREELAGTGVTVTVLMPGPTETPFFKRANMPSGSMHKDDPVEVARAGFAGLLNGDALVAMTPPRNKLRARIGPFLPRPLKTALRRMLPKPGPR
jgi:short-subunit dehydrogenase